MNTQANIQSLRDWQADALKACALRQARAIADPTDRFLELREFVADNPELNVWMYDYANMIQRLIMIAYKRKN